MPRYGATAQERLDALDKSPLHPPARHELDEQRRQLLEGTGFRGQEWYIPYLYSQPASLLDFLPADALVLVDDGAELMILATELEAQAGQTQRDLITGGDLPANPLPPHFTWQQLKEPLLARAPLLLGHGDLEGRIAPAGSPLARHFTPGPRFGGQVKQIVAEVEKQQQQGQRRGAGHSPGPAAGRDLPGGGRPAADGRGRDRRCAAAARRAAGQGRVERGLGAAWAGAQD